MQVSCGFHAEFHAGFHAEFHAGFHAAFHAEFRAAFRAGFPQNNEVPRKRVPLGTFGAPGAPLPDRFARPWAASWVPSVIARYF